MDVEELKKRYTGCMLGAAIGDALGKQNESLRREDILKRGYVTDYGNAPKGCPGEMLRPGQYTDDTEQMILLARSLIACHGYDASDFASRIAKWGVKMKESKTKSRLLGPSSSISISKLNAGVSWVESGSHIASCGSAMRAAPIGLFYKNINEVESKAMLSSIPTHKSNGAIAGAVAVAVAVRFALGGYNCQGIIKEAIARASNHDIGLARKLDLSCSLRNEAPDVVFGKLGTSCSVYDTVPCAFYCFTKNIDRPEMAVIEAINAGGDTDSIGCITGALCGAFHGIGAFQQIWIDGLENRKGIERIAIRLYAKSIQIQKISMDSKF